MEGLETSNFVCFKSTSVHNQTMHHMAVGTKPMHKDLFQIPVLTSVHPGVSPTLLRFARTRYPGTEDIPIPGNFGETKCFGHVFQFLQGFSSDSVRKFSKCVWKTSEFLHGSNRIKVKFCLAETNFASVFAENVSAVLGYPAYADREV
jgi:hypothetical protein